jgi:hypothetical protein
MSNHGCDRAGVVENDTPPPVAQSASVGVSGTVQAVELSDPAWTSAFVFSPSVDICSKSNHRRAPKSSEWSRFRAFEDAIAFDARVHLPASWPDLAADRPLAQRPVVCLVIVASTLLDATNLAKSVADALEGICYTNDASARAATSLSVRSRTRSASVALCALDPGVALRDASVALSRLTLAALDHFEAAGSA